MTLEARAICRCMVVKLPSVDWYMCGQCASMIQVNPKAVLTLECNAARMIFNIHYEGTPDYYFEVDDGSIIVGKEGIGYVRALPNEVLETGTIDKDGYWIPTE